MATLGLSDLKQFTLPTYWDAAYLERYRLADGATYEQVVADIQAALQIANRDVLSDPLYAGLISLTDEIAVEYSIGVSNGFQTHTEYSKPDEKRGATGGHMLPILPVDRGLGWTWDYLRKARRSQIEADIASAIKDWKDCWAQKVLTRLFKSTYDSVGSGRSMPLADGGTADSTYVPVAYPERGGTFLSTHDHIHHQNGINQTNLETVVAHLWEHGLNPPFELLIAQADISSWTNTTNVTGFVPRPDPLLRYGATADLANVGEDFIGAVETDYGACRVRACGRVPTTMWSVYKSYGALDQRNPLRVRVGSLGPGAILLKGEGIREFPLERAIIFAEFGVGVNDRIAAYAAKNDAAAYADPTIS